MLEAISSCVRLYLRFFTKWPRFRVMRIDDADDDDRTTPARPAACFPFEPPGSMYTEEVKTHVLLSALQRKVGDSTQASICAVPPQDQLYSLLLLVACIQTRKDVHVHAWSKNIKLSRTHHPSPRSLLDNARSARPSL